MPVFYSQESDTVFISHFDSLTIGNNLLVELFECYYAKMQSMFIQSCYAFKPGPPEITFVNRIDSIQMTTVNDYNSSYLAGSWLVNISDYSLKVNNNPNWSSRHKTNPMFFFVMMSVIVFLLTTYSLKSL
jgi:hypothetical protein